MPPLRGSKNTHPFPRGLPECRRDAAFLGCPPEQCDTFIYMVFEKTNATLWLL
jgi:hypothetical protein